MGKPALLTKASNLERRDMKRKVFIEDAILSLQTSALEQRQRADFYFTLAERSGSPLDRAAYEDFAAQAIASAERLEKRAKAASHRRMSSAA